MTVEWHITCEARYLHTAEKCCDGRRVCWLAYRSRSTHSAACVRIFFSFWIRWLTQFVHHSVLDCHLMANLRLLIGFYWTKWMQIKTDWSRSVKLKQNRMRIKRHRIKSQRFNGHRIAIEPRATFFENMADNLRALKLKCLSQYKVI